MKLSNIPSQLTTAYTEMLGGPSKDIKFLHFLAARDSLRYFESLRSKSEAIFSGEPLENLVVDVDYTAVPAVLRLLKFQSVEKILADTHPELLAMVQQYFHDTKRSEGQRVLVQFKVPGELSETPQYTVLQLSLPRNSKRGIAPRRIPLHHYDQSPLEARGDEIDEVMDRTGLTTDIFFEDDPLDIVKNEVKAVLDILDEELTLALVNALKA